MDASARSGVQAALTPAERSHFPNQQRLEFPPDDGATVFLVGGKKLRAQFREEFRCLLEVQAVAVLREVFDDRL